MLHKYKQILPIVLTIMLISCGKKDNPVPLTSINYVIYNVESDSRYSNLRISGGSEYLKAGNICVGYNCNGVVLYRMKTAGETDDFRAYDRTCPYEANDCSIQNDLCIRLCQRAALFRRQPQANQTGGLPYCRQLAQDDAETRATPAINHWLCRTSGGLRVGSVTLACRFSCFPHLPSVART